MSDRVLGSDVLTATMAHEPLPPDEAVVGAPTTAGWPLGEVAGAEVGVWEMSEGTARDTEADEIFVVLSGSGVVEFADGSSVELCPGVAVRLNAGEQTSWTVREPLRKIYVAG
jgi:uncharacterized protein